MANVRGTSITGSRGYSDPNVSRWRGYAIPFVRRSKGFFSICGTREIIWSSIVNILLTPIGTRIMLPEFGSILPELVYEPNDEVLVSLGQRGVIDAVVRWEPRVQMRTAFVSRDIYNDHHLVVSMTYEIVGEMGEERRTLPVSPNLLIAASRS